MSIHIPKEIEAIIISYSDNIIEIIKNIKEYRYNRKIWEII